MEKILKIKLLSYLLVSALSFTALIMPEQAGISVPIFVLIQLAALFYIVPDRKALLLFGPIFILALNSFISGSDIWHIPNLIVVAVLYGLMALLASGEYEIGASSVQFIADLARAVYRPLAFFKLPQKWALETSQNQGRLVKRVLVGLMASLPCLILLIMALSSADEIFSRSAREMLAGSHSIFHPKYLLKLACGFAAGFYLFGLACSSHQPREEMNIELNPEFNDLIVINIVLASVLAVYTIFTIIQFKYLFAGGGQLPYGLTYSYYARRGFFELLFLSGFNILAILLVINLSWAEVGPGAALTRVLCGYLCLITFILLISSFYRMWLYNADSGLTRLRFLVFGFLVFEGLGLVFTFFYIIKPHFNIIAVYLGLGLIYYLLLNIIPMDFYVAKSQIDRYLDSGQGDPQYALSLSSDAAPQIARLLPSDNLHWRTQAQRYFLKQGKYERVSGWQKFNLSFERCQRVFTQPEDGHWQVD